MESNSAAKRKAKIVATIGPSSSSPQVIAEMIHAGMNVARLNFSHGTHEEHKIVLDAIREEAKKQNVHICIFQDLCGPKVRIGQFENGEITLKDNSTINLKYITGENGTENCLYIESFDPVKVIKPGEKILLADGRIELLAQEVKGDVVVCKVTAGGLLRSKSGLAVPDSKLEISALTDKDLKDLVWAVKNKVDFIALSFVNSSKDVILLRSKLKELDSEIPIIAKIERAKSLDNINELAEAAEVLMIARGDLGLELPLEKVPNAQKLIIKTANNSGTPVITATQMLVSMVNEVRPTRAEVSDVYTAIKDGSDCVMLSEETAIGKHPVLAIKVLDRIICEAEATLVYNKKQLKTNASSYGSISDAISFAASNAAEKISATAIIACTQSGSTAKLIAKYRPLQTLFAATSEPKVLNRIALYWGTTPVYVETKGTELSTEEEVNLAMSAVRDRYGVKPGARVIVTVGLRTKKIGATNVMEIREIPR